MHRAPWVKKKLVISCPGEKYNSGYHMIVCMIT